MSIKTLFPHLVLEFDSGTPEIGISDFHWRLRSIVVVVIFSMLYIPIFRVWQKRYPWTKPWSHQQKEPSTNWWTPGNRTTTKRSSNNLRTSEWIGQPCWRISLVWKLNPWRTWRWISLISMVTWCLTSTAWRGQWRRWSWRHLSLRISRVSLKLYR